MNEAAEFRDLVALLGMAVLAPLVTRASNRVRIPAVVVEIVLGMLTGPQVLGWVQDDGLVDIFATFGLALLFFLAGFEIDPARRRGKPLQLAGTAWMASLVLGLAVGTVLSTTVS